ncbi:cytochrome b [Jeongeupia chitinilytica]|uniref:Cytochrome b n=1 Tax=Jeongeupia chitinilytica TaxID=1041641 RepID=A0ABQ3H3B1_9NEIS|nr:cytochrome b [Jeongeupia chitinilytica]GHD68363.1 cytochrome b [Jeongeupia chitinilytica]
MSTTRYHPLSIGLHWLMFLLFVAVYAAIELKGFIPKGEPLRAQATSVHMLCGQLILLFACVRLLARWRFGAPPVLGHSAAQRLAAHAGHLLLYLVMFVMPLTGIVFTQAGGREVTFFGLQLPHLVAADPALKASVKAFHELVGNAVYFLIGIHVAAAVWHHVVLKDDTLRRMRPSSR